MPEARKSVNLNPLSKFRSYSYHHVLIACENTQVARSLTATTEIVGFVRHANPFDRFAPLTIKTADNTEGKYIVVINGMTDADFVIESTSWYTSTAAHVSGGDRYTSLAVEGDLQVFEPKGYQFLNILSQTCRVLGTDAIGVVWMLKTIFVGHGDDGQTDIISNVPPLLFFMMEVSGKFGAFGGRYSVTFAGMNNGTSRLPQIIRAAEGINVNLGKNNKGTLVGAMKALEDTINTNYDKFYSCVTAAYNKVVSNSTLATDVKTRATENPPFKRVKYTIELDSQYTQNPEKYSVTDSSQATKPGKGLCDEPVMLTMNNGSTVEDAIHAVMQYSTEVKRDFTTPVVNVNTTYQYRIFSTIENKSDEYEVKYKVFRYPIFRNQVIEGALTGAKTQGELNDIIQRNLIEFDYIYTGRNTDILNFEMKMELGLAFLLSYAGSLRTLPDQNSRDNFTREIIISSTGIENRLNELTNPETNTPTQTLTKTPLFMGTTVKESALNNSQNPALSASYASSFSQLASLESAEAMLEILGNPYLLGTAAVEPLTEEERRLRKSLQGTDQDELTFQDWGAVPAIAKINVRMPRSSDDIEAINSRQDYSEQFWYDGYFYIYAIRHIFNNGKFTQELEMFSFPNASVFDNTTPEKTNILCNEYAEADNRGAGGADPHSGGKIITLKSPGTYTLTQKRNLDIAFHLYRGDLNQDYQKISNTTPPELIQAILLNESNAGEAFASGKPKVGDLNLPKPAYGICQMQVGVARKLMKENIKLAFISKNVIGGEDLQNFDAANSDAYIIELLQRDDVFAIAMAYVYISKDVVGNQKVSSTNYELLLRYYNGSPAVAKDVPNAASATVVAGNKLYGRNGLTNMVNAAEYNKKTFAATGILVAEDQIRARVAFIDSPGESILDKEKQPVLDTHSATKGQGRFRQGPEGSGGHRAGGVTAEEQQKHSCGKVKG